MHERFRSTSRRAAAAIAFATAACAASIAFGVPLRAAPPGADDANAVSPGASTFEARGRVLGVDPATNSVTIRSARGRRYTFAVDPEIADVSRLAPGDRVDIVYRHALLLRVDPAGSSGIRSQVDTTTTAPAAGGVTATTHRVEVNATVLTIDRANRRLTVRGPDGTVVLDVPPNVALDSVRVGEQVRASYVTENAVQVTRDGLPVR